MLVNQPLRNGSSTGGRGGTPSLAVRSNMRVSKRPSWFRSTIMVSAPRTTRSLLSGKPKSGPISTTINGAPFTLMQGVKLRG